MKICQHTAGAVLGRSTETSGERYRLEWIDCWDKNGACRSIEPGPTTRIHRLDDSAKAQLTTTYADREDMKLIIVLIPIAALLASCTASQTPDIVALVNGDPNDTVVIHPDQLENWDYQIDDSGEVTVFPQSDYGNGCVVHQGPDGPHFRTDEAKSACREMGLAISDGEVISLD